MSKCVPSVTTLQRHAWNLSYRCVKILTKKQYYLKYSRHRNSIRNASYVNYYITSDY